MADDTTEASEPKPRKGKKALVPALVILLGLGGGGYFFLTSKQAAQAETAHATTTTEYGKIIRLQSMTMNLSDGRILKVGLALAVVAEPKDEELAILVAPHAPGAKPVESISVSPMAGLESKALNQAILVLGDKTFEALSKPGAREVAKKELSEKIEGVFHGDVVKIYFTEFVMA